MIVSIETKYKYYYFTEFGTMDDVSAELKAFLNYVAGRKSEDAFVKQLEEAVQKAKENREWRHEYMTLLMRDQANLERGIEQGEEQLSDLIGRLLQDQRFKDIERVTKDKEYRQLLYAEYHIL